MFDSNPQRSLQISTVLLADHVDRRLITTKNHPTLPLEIHNYTSRAFSSSSSSSRSPSLALSIACRTLITETTTGLVVSRSFSKFFNHHEKLAYKPTGSEHDFTIEEKVDGSIISLFFYSGEWRMVSRASFDSVHINAAWKIMGNRYPDALKRNVLDTEKTYVFELVDPNMPIKVRYEKKDLVLLSIVGKDGQEPPYDFDWSKLPFSRPKTHTAKSVNPKELSKLNHDNEEGFVVKFWLSKTDTYPQRIKVKFESYLKSIQPEQVIDSMAKISISQKPKAVDSNKLQLNATAPPTYRSLVDLYTTHRLKVPSFNNSVVKSRMGAIKDQYLRLLDDSDVADDYGDEMWFDVIKKTWDRIHALCSLQEDDWQQTLEKLQVEGYKPGKVKGSKHVNPKQVFEKRIRRNDVDRSFRDALTAWFDGVNEAKLVRLVIEKLEVPLDLRSGDVITLES